MTTDDKENQENIELYLALMDKYKMLRTDPAKLEEADELFQAAQELYEFLDLTDEQIEDLMNAVG